MGIKTKHQVVIEIDGKSFSVIASRQMTSSQKDEFTSVKNKHEESFTKRDAFQSKLNLLQEEFEINKLILRHGSAVEIVKVMFEQKKHNRDIHDLKKKLVELDKTIATLDEAMEEMSEKRYDLLVSGTDKAALKNEVEALGISYRALFAEFASEIEKSQEKK